MAYNTKKIKRDVDGNPVPQMYNPAIDDYEVLQGGSGASKVDVEASALPAGAATEAKQDSTISELQNLQGKDFATQTTLAAILSKIISAPATEAKQNALNALIGEVQANPTANTLLARIKNLETKLDGIISGTSPASVQLTGSNVEIGGKTYVVSGGDTIRGKAADKPDAVAAHAAIPYCYYHAIDTGTVEATDGTNWVVI